MNMENLYREIKRIASKYDDLKKIVLFGSRARGDNKSTSDVDLAIFPLKEDFESETKFWFDIEDIDTLLQFDVVVIKDDTCKELMKNINREGVIIYEQSETKIPK